MGIEVYNSFTRRFHEYTTHRSRSSLNNAWQFKSWKAIYESIFRVHSKYSYEVKHICEMQALFISQTASIFGTFDNRNGSAEVRLFITNNHADGLITTRKASGGVLLAQARLGPYVDKTTIQIDLAIVIVCECPEGTCCRWPGPD
jgi:hypothetical protein